MFRVISLRNKHPEMQQRKTAEYGPRFCGLRVWTGHGAMAWLRGTIFGASAEKTHRLGVTEPLGAGIIRKLLPSHVGWMGCGDSRAALN